MFEFALPCMYTSFSLYSLGFISSHLTADKLLTVNSRAITYPQKISLVLETKSMPALIINPRLYLVTHTDGLGCYITSNQQGQMFIQNLNRIGGKPNVTPDRSCIGPQTVSQLTWCFRKIFLLTHKFGTTWDIEMTTDREEWSELPIIATSATRIRSGTSAIRRIRVPPTKNRSQPETAATHLWRRWGAALKEAVGSLRKRTHPPLEQYTTWTRTTTAKLSKLIRLTACKKTKHTVSRLYRTVYIPWLSASYDTHKGKRWLNSNPTRHRGRIMMNQ